MVERHRHAAVGAFFCDVPLAAGAEVTPGDDVVNHLRARRVDDGEVVQLTDGAGTLADATVHLDGRRRARFRVSAVHPVGRQPAIHLCAPVADRDRMLWLAEKAAELEIATWRAVRFRRSASVTPRGEGESFASRARLRMISAVEQSRGAWLPTLLPDADIAELCALAPERRIVMDPAGDPILDVVGAHGAAPPPTTLLVGPEGGIEDDELDRLAAAGWRRARLGATMLRFETAALAAIAVVRAAQRLPED